jgi:hypothetical protein
MKCQVRPRREKYDRRTVRSSHEWRNIQQSGGSVPLFTVTMKSNGVNKQEGRLSRAIHAASIAAGYPEDDFFQRFLSLGPSDLRVDLYYPALRKPRTDEMLMIEVLVSSGTDTDRKKSLVAPRPSRKAWRSRHRPNRQNGVLSGDRSCERIIRWRRLLSH